MALACPYCHHSVSLKDAKPGKYKPKCPKCEKRFLLFVPAQADVAPTAAPLPDEAEGTLASSASPPASVPAPAPPSKSAASERTTPAASAPQFDVTLPGASEATMPAAVEATLPPSNSGSSRTAHDLAPDQAQDRTHAGPSDRTTPAMDATMPALASHPAASSPNAVDATMPQRAAAATALGTAAGRSAASSAAATPSGAMPDSLGGYKLLKELGRGAMGAVYLAKQLSLNRNVALKLIQAQWASNPSFVARFMREAYAAAQLTHHNVVQIYDLGADGDVNFFSMEFVNGQSLADLIAKQGPLEPQVAVGYVLQAARGLQFAHQQGMVHRDVKPANLMVNDQGVVKVADLGLVKAPQLADDLGPDALEASKVGGPLSGSLAAAASNVTLANTAMGTPAYMAPEQAENATGVDHRADIYSLGCSLYVLLVGRTPFEGGTALEVITKHKSKPIEWPASMAAKIPAGLSAVVMKMVAKKPEERYANLAEVIGDLEKFLHGARPEQVERRQTQSQGLRAAAGQFSDVATAKLRPLGAAALVCGTFGLAAILLLVSLQAAIGMLTFGLAAATTYFVIGGLNARTYLFDKSRAALATLRWSDWATAAASGLLVLAIIAVAGWLLGVLGGAILGAAVGAAWYFVIDKPLARRRAASLEQAEAIVKEMRLRGDDELAIHRFVVEAGGATNEEFFEALFGYEAKLTQRAALAGTETGRRWKKYGAWRDPLVRRLEARIAAARESRDQAKLQKIEEKGLAAQGVSPEEARAQAEAMAMAMVKEMLAQREQAAQPSANATTVDPRVAAARKRERFRQMMSEARSAPKRRWSALLTGPLGFALSGKLRFLAGCLLLVGFALWLRDNGLLSAEKFQELNPSAHGLMDRVQALVGGSSATAKPLGVPVVGRLFTSFAPALAGLILLVTGLFRGVKMSFFAWPAAVVVLFAPTFGWNPLYGAAGGAALAAAGILLGRTSRE